MRGDNRQKVLDFIRISHPKSVNSADIVRRTGVSQPQVYQITRSLMKSGLVRAARNGRAWYYTWNAPAASPMPAPGQTTAHAFANLARDHFSRVLNEDLNISEQSPAVFLLSGETSAGFALHFTPAQNGRVPPARPMLINGYLWLLEKGEMERIFIALGGDEATARTWAENYAALCLDAMAIYVSACGKVRALT